MEEGAGNRHLLSSTDVAPSLAILIQRRATATGNGFSKPVLNGNDNGGRNTAAISNSRLPEHGQMVATCKRLDIVSFIAGVRSWGR